MSTNRVNARPTGLTDPWLHFKGVFSLISIQFPVDLVYLFAPPLSFPVLHLHDGLVGPVKMIGHEGYLLVNAFEGVARYSPEG